MTQSQHTPRTASPDHGSRLQHAVTVRPEHSQAWPDFQCGGSDPDFASERSPRRGAGTARLRGVVDGALRFLRG